MLRRLVSQTVQFQKVSSRIALLPTVKLSLSTSAQQQPRRIKNLVSNTDNRLLEITWDDATVSRYPFVYLRDICKCPECFHDSSKQRSFDSVAGLDNNLVASTVDVELDGKQMTLTWPNKHTTSFSSNWLYKRRLHEEREENHDSESLHFDGEVQLWDSKMTGNIPTLLFQDILSKKASQIQWLDFIGCHGITLIKEAPTEPGQVHKLGETLGFLKEMWFGKSYQTHIGQNGNNGTMLSAVPQSTCPYDEYRGGLHLIHCQNCVEGPGGEHTFVDGFHIAKLLKQIDPEAFNHLCTSPMMFQRNVANGNSELNMKFSRPLIRLDSNGCFTGIIYNESNRNTFVHATPEEIPKLYQAYYKLAGLIRDPRNIIRHKLEAGDIMTYDCNRVFCGKSPIEPGGIGTEVLESAFTDKDMTKSRRKTLKENLANEVD